MNHMNGAEATEAQERVTAEWECQAKVARNGTAKSALRRKVLTKGVIGVAVRTDFLKQALRKGYEVRYTDADGNPLFRVFPVLSADCRRIWAAAQAMKPFTEEAYEGIRPKCLHGGKAMAEGEVDELRRAAFVANRAAKAFRMQEVTPDTVVQCPNCGNRFRVGRSTAKK